MKFPVWSWFIAWTTVRNTRKSGLRSLCVKLPEVGLSNVDDDDDDDDDEDDDVVSCVVFQSPS